MQDERENKPTPDADAEAKQRGEEGRKNRDEMDDVPPHGTDPLHEGP